MLSTPAAVDLLLMLSNATCLLANASSPTFLSPMLSLSIIPPQCSFSHISLVTLPPSPLAFLIPLSLHVLSLQLLILNVFPIASTPSLSLVSFILSEEL